MTIIYQSPTKIVSKWVYAVELKQGGKWFQAYLYLDKERALARAKYLTSLGDIVRVIELIEEHEEVAD